MEDLFQYLGLIGFGGIIGIFIKHFLDKDKEKMFFKLSFIREKHLTQKEKCFILLEKIDEVKNNFIILQIKGIKNIEDNLNEINKYWKDKNYIINLISTYLPELKIYTDKYLIAHKNYEKIIDLSKKIYINGFDENNKLLLETIQKFENDYFQYLDDLKDNIKNYLIKKEKEFTN